MASTMHQPPKELLRVIGGSIVLHAVIITAAIVILNHAPKREFLTPVYSVSLIAPEKKVQKTPAVKVQAKPPVKPAPIKTKTIKTIKTAPVKKEKQKSITVVDDSAKKEQKKKKTEAIETAVEKIKKDLVKQEEQKLIASRIAELAGRTEAEDVNRKKRLEEIRSGLIFRDEKEKEKPEATEAPVQSTTGTEANGLEASLYLSLLRDQIQNEWSYPEVMRGKNLSVIVGIKIDRAGRIVKLNVEKSSGNPRFDDSLLRAVKKAAPFSPLPEDFKNRYLETGLRFCPSCKDME